MLYLTEYSSTRSRKSIVERLTVSAAHP